MRKLWEDFLHAAVVQHDKFAVCGCTGSQYSGSAEEEPELWLAVFVCVCV